ncbi:hypothetical protein GJAV_G00244000 [Gymnothorax javanicus]|nr:hypothetical protein GJAV_G00244000 [Gymnothorax javanicus]
MSGSWKIIVPLLAWFLAVGSAKPIIGGLTDADLEDQEVRDALEYAVNQTISERNAPFLRKMTHIGKAQQQVVVGIMYTLQADMATTNCSKGEDEMRQCVMHPDPRIRFHESCTFTVWIHPWTGRKEMLQIGCVA